MKHLLALSLLFVASCSSEEPALVISLVPNPEINTREDVATHVNRLDVLFDAQDGLAGLDGHEEGDSFGPFLVTDIDDDGFFELLLSRRGDEALEAFAVTPGHQADRLLAISARGYDTSGALTALGGATGGFDQQRDTTVEIPFNLVPEYRPLRVLSMLPPSGARDLDPPIEDVTLQLSGEVRESSLLEQVTLRAADEDALANVTVSYVDTAMGRLTNVRLLDCVLSGGPTTVTVSTAVCSVTGQCLDQHLGVDGQQPYVGGFTVAGAPSAPLCQAITVESTSCPELPCEEGFTCVDGACVYDTLSQPEMGPSSSCDPELCRAPENLCSPEGNCVTDCRFYGACPQPELQCDAETGICLY